MNCPYCLSDKTTVYNSRPSKKLNQVWRRRQCLNCKKQFTTTEHVDLGLIIKIKNRSDKKLQDYSKAKLLTSLLRSCDHRQNQDNDALYLLETIEQKLLKESANSDQVVQTSKVRTTVMQVLQNFDKVAAIKYKSYYA